MKQRSNPQAAARKGPTFCARVPSVSEGVARRRVSIEFAPFPAAARLIPAAISQEATA
jgi:hypothetical protein